MRFLGFLKRFALLVAVYVLSGGLFASSVLVSEPKFSQHSTEQGLSQDTVNDILTDADGFLWIATDSGLNRYDGYRNTQVQGTNNEFADDAIYKLYQDWSGNLWVSTASSGVAQYNRKSGKSEFILRVPYKEQPEWLQGAQWFLQTDDTHILIGLDHALINLDLTTKQYDVLFDLMAWTDNQQNIIRYALSYQNVIFIATAEGLLAFNTDTKQVVHIDYLGDIDKTINNVNAKQLHIGNSRLWIGTVEGLYSISLDEVMDYVRAGEGKLSPFQEIPQRNIWSMLQIKGDEYYLSTDLGMYIFNFATREITHLFKPSDSRLMLSDNDIVDMVVTATGKLWLATRTDGVLLWSPFSLNFTNVARSFNNDKESKQLSHNQVNWLYQHSDESLWIGTMNGLNRYDSATGDVESYLVSTDEKAVIREGSIFTIQPSLSPGKVWLLTGKGIVKFDLDERRIVLANLSEKAQTVFTSQDVYSIFPVGNGRYIVTTSEQFFEFNEYTGELVSNESLNTSIATNQFFNFIPSDVQQEVMIAMTGQLWKYNSATGETSLIHSLPKQLGQFSIAPVPPVVDANGIMWVAYPGYGLFGLDPSTFEQRYFFSAKDILPTNMIFGLHKDRDGNIWMSSHKGLLKFYPDTQYFKQYTVKDGLPTNEFNWGADRQLSDGRLAYGSQKGVTLFSPDSLKLNTESLQGESDVVITSVSLVSRELNLGLSNLNGSDIVLEHDDLGLKIGFSNMRFDSRQSSLYRYSLNGPTSVEYPVSQNTDVEFPKLPPGKYTFSVSALDSESGEFGEQATLSIRVNHAPFTSPMAYTLYALIGLTLILSYWYQRRRQNRALVKAHRATLRSKSRLSMALKASNSNVWEWRKNTNRIYQMRVHHELGYDAGSDEHDFAYHLTLIHEQDKPFFISQWDKVTSGVISAFDMTYRMRMADGSYAWYRDIGAIVSSADEPEDIMMVGTYTNITDSIHTQEQAKLFGEAFQHTRDWVVIFNRKYQPIATNKAFNYAFGVIEERDLSEQLQKLFVFERESMPEYAKKMTSLAPGEHWEGEDFLETLKGDSYHIQVKVSAISAVHDPSQIDRYLMILTDISEQKEAEAALWQLANYDSLTNLPNRALLLDRIKHACDQADREKQIVGLFFIDLDGFKKVNDSLGHDAGDELLKTISARILKVLRQSDTVARLGGDEFVVMVEHVEHIDVLRTLASNIIHQVEKPIVLKAQMVSVSASIGIALYPTDASQPSELLKNADIAMYHAKELGKSQFQYYTKSLNHQVQENLKLESRIKQAHINKQFENYYQPIVDATTGKVKGLELLMRWPTEQGMISPDVFIPAAESLGLIEALTTDAIWRALPVLESLHEIDKDCYLSVNLSARKLGSQNYLLKLVEILKTVGLPTSCVRFEITESTLMSDYRKAQQLMDEMRAYGFKIALDDFGTGYSSLKYLQNLPVDVIKIDKSFVREIGVSRNNEAIIQAILRIAESLELQCIAEGIETEEQLAFLQKNHCGYLQGFYFARPLPREDIFEVITRLNNKL